MPIHFGTDGWRAVISDTFTFHNLRLVTQAIADALVADNRTNGDALIDGKKPKMSVVIGFDTRFLSDRYAGDASRVLAANGFKAYLAQSDCPTPAVSYSIRDLNAKAGIMITASHNPPRYNGIKLKSEHGSSAPREQCRRVEVYLNDNESRGRGPNQMDFKLALEMGFIEKIDIFEHYFEHLRGLIDFDVICERKLKVAVDSMFGSGRGVIANILGGTGCGVTEVRGEMNPGFGGAHPEPIAIYLDPLKDEIARTGADIGLALDGDADRIGAMDEKGNFVDPHKIMCLTLKHLYEKRNLRGNVVRTVSTTRMIDRLANKYGLKVHETPVGFNYIADLMMTEDILLGGEESGGISFKGHIPEGDGILMGLMMLEILSSSDKPLSELVEDLNNEVGPVYYERKDLRLKRPLEKEVMTRKLADNAPEAIGGEKVVDILTVDGCKYILEDDSWLLIRPSGTEPVLRVYAEGRSKEMVKAMLDYGEKVANGAAKK